jgi:hypothetical protein
MSEGCPLILPAMVFLLEGSLHFIADIWFKPTLISGTNTACPKLRSADFCPSSSIRITVTIANPFNQLG